MTPRTLRTTTATRRDADDDDRVDDPLHDDGPEDRGAAHALALAQRMAAYQFAEARRQDVVGEVADVGVAEDPAVRDRL